MTAGLPYLRNLRKTDLVELAENSKLKNYLDLKKSDLEVALDKHLWVNRTKLSGESSLADYFRRAGGAAASAASAAGVVKTPARGRAKPTSDGEESSSRSGSPIPIVKVIKRTPSRARAAASSATSAAAANAPALAATLDRTSVRLRRLLARVVDFFEESHLTAYLRLAREYLGSAWAIQLALLGVEIIGLLRNLVPQKQLFNTSHFKLWVFGSPIMPLTAIYTVDPSFFFTSLFWRVTSLYVTIGHIVPLVVAYVANPSVGANLSYSGGGGGSRRSTRFSGGKVCFDPLMFALSRGLIMQHILKNKAQIVPLDMVWSPSVVDFLAQCLPGGVSWVVTRSVVAAVVTLYEAVLRK